MSYKSKKLQFHGLQIATGSPAAESSKTVFGRASRKNMAISPRARQKQRKPGHRRFLGFRAMESLWTGQLAGGIGTGTGTGGGGPIGEA